jgi:hypothetical protein
MLERRGRVLRRSRFKEDRMAGKKRTPMRAKHRQRPRRTPEEARQFEKFSIGNATVLAEAAVARGCGCEPYADWFTLPRWNDQGFSVKKGEHGTPLMVVVDVPADEESDSRSEPRTRCYRAFLFCRCQVEARQEKEMAR